MITSKITERLRSVECRVMDWVDRRGATCMRVSLGIIFLWFGGLKLTPGLSPAEALVGQTVLELTSGMVGPAISIPSLGIAETMLGISFLTGIGLRYSILLLFGHMAGTAMPFLVLPEVVFGAEFPGLTLEGQYIVKNLVIISGALIVGAKVLRGAVTDRRGCRDGTVDPADAIIEFPGSGLRHEVEEGMGGPPSRSAP